MVCLCPLLDRGPVQDVFPAFILCVLGQSPEDPSDTVKIQSG